jgi:hypothetical protein
MNLEPKKTGKTNPRFPAATRRYPRFERRRACSASRGAAAFAHFGKSGDEAATDGYLTPAE